MDEQRWRERAGSFGAAAEVYERSRPSYPVEAVRAALPAAATRVLDVGAGTGKLTGVLVDLGLDVIAVEPSEQMRALLPGRAQVLAGSAESLPVPDGSVDAVVAGQAFHWFDAPVALAEMARVLRPGGTVGLLWNLRDESVDWVRAIGDLWGDDCSDRMHGQKPFDTFPGLTPPVRQEFSYGQLLDVDQLVDLAASRSALLTMPGPQRLAVLEQVRALAPSSDSFEMPYNTVLWRSERV